MAGLIAFNPYVTTNAAGSFNIETTGFVQGTLLDNPAGNMHIAGGIVALTANTSMWGGMGITELIPYPGGLTTPNGYGASQETWNALGGNLLLAQTIGGTNPLTGFTVFNMAQALVNMPQSPVPAAGPGASINYVRLGSGVRLAVACDPTLVSLEGGVITQQVSWDFNEQQLIPYSASYNQIAFSAMSWASTNGGTVTGTLASSPALVPGDVFTVSGVVPTAYNGEYTAITGTSGTTIVFALPAASTPGSVTTQGVLVAGGGAVPVQVLGIYPGNSMTVLYNTATGFANWNRSGCCAVIKI